MYKFTILLTITFLLQLSCLGDAERNNPLDSKSSKFSGDGKISGTTSALSGPVALSGVEVELEPGPFFAVSDAAGHFVFESIPAGGYAIVAAKTGYADSQDSVQVELDAVTQILLRLDALPVIDSVAVSSRHIARNFPADPLVLLEVVARVDDLDGFGDLALVEVQIPALNYSETLAETSERGIFQKILPQSEWPYGVFDNVIGLRIFVRAFDRAGALTVSQPHHLSRIISQATEVLAPQGGALFDVANEVLTWRALELPFDFSFEVEVSRFFQLGLETVVWTKSGIDKAETSLAIATDLSDGIYFWTISVVDAFGNRSRSLGASFQIKL